MMKEKQAVEPKLKVPDFVASLMKEYGEKGVVIDGSRVDCDFFDTGNYALNFNLSGRWDGGWPEGQVTIISGDPSTGKSLLMKHAMEEFAKKHPDGIVILDDTENAYVDYSGSSVGKVEGRFMRVSTDSVEEHSALMFDGQRNPNNPKKFDVEPLIPKISAAGIKHILIVVDSIAAWSTEHELEVGLDRPDMSKAKVLKALFRIIKDDMKQYNVTYMVTNHLIHTIGDFMVPSKKIEPGGGGPAFQASVRVCLALASKIKEKGQEKSRNDDNNIIGIVTKAQTQKNRFYPPYRSCELKIFFDRGVDRYSGLIPLLEGIGIIKLGNGGWYEVVGKDEKFQSKDLPTMWPKLKALIKPEHTKIKSDASVD